MTLGSKSHDDITEEHLFLNLSLLPLLLKQIFLSSFTGWINHNLYFLMKQKKCYLCQVVLLVCSLVLFWRQQNHSIQSNKCPLSELRNSLAQIFRIPLFIAFFCSTGGSSSLKASTKRKKILGQCKPLPPSKRLRLEAQRVLKERVQRIADKKGIKLRFCSLKDCEGQHIRARESPCNQIRMELGWPPGVPFVHPHDLPNKAKLGFLEAFEPGWTVSQHDMDLAFIEPGHHG